MNTFEFISAGKIVFGNGVFQKTAEYAAGLGQRALIVSSQGALARSGVLSKLEAQLQSQNIQYTYFNRVVTEPTPELVDQGCQLARASRCDMVICIGGGSNIDAGKAIAGLVTNGGHCVDYLEGVGSGKTIQKPGLPCVAIPTTAGTGAEVTKNAVIASRDQKYKKSMRSPQLIPRIALVDPELTISLPPKQTAFSGMDALTQCIEAYVSKKAQPMTDILALEGIRRGGRSLLNAYENGADRIAREDMAMCSLLSGLALANSGLGAAHGIGAALGALFHAPHGLACAMMLAPVMGLNRDVNLSKFATIGQALTGESQGTQQADAETAVRFIENLTRQLHIPSRLGEIGVTSENVELLARKSAGSSMSGNPKELSDAELINLLTHML